MSYAPDKIPWWSQILRLLFSLLLLTVALGGLVTDDFSLPRTGWRTNRIHLHGWSAILMSAAFCCAALHVLTPIISHYDETDNEWRYTGFQRICGRVGWLLVFLAIGWYFYTEFFTNANAA